MAEAESPPFAAPPVIVPLEAREREVLDHLASDMDAWVSFQGLRRGLGVHQQALVRTLRRLERDGLVLHDGRGYALTASGAAALAGSSPLPPPAALAPRVPLLEAMLPPHVDARAVVEHLARRWFQGLHWHGMAEAPGESVLQWTLAGGGGRVLARVGGGTLVIELEADPAPAAFSALRPLLGALAELYGARHGRGQGLGPNA